MTQAQQPQQSTTPRLDAPALSQKRDVIEKLVETGLDDSSANAVNDLLSQDFVLGKIRQADREYARLMAKNVVHFVQCDYPPKESMCQGILRMGLTGDMDDGKTALSEEQKTQIESLLLGMFFRTSRSIDGWQQDKFGEQIQTRRMEDGREDAKKGPLGGLFS